MQRPPISAPWQGWRDDNPSLVLPPNSFKQITAMLLNKGRIQTLPKRNAFPNPPDGNPILGARTFQDALNNLHTLVVTRGQAYYLNQTNVYTAVGAPFTSMSDFPYAIEVMLGKVYIANGGQKVTAYDGSATVSIPGSVPGTCYYLGKLATHLIMANTIEPEPGVVASTVNPARVRWSKSGDPTNWVDFTSGFEDIQDIEDQISGYATLGQNGFVFRTNGITVMTPTGIGLAPFTIENFSIGPTGIGNAYPYSLAVYGSFSIFVGLDDVYYFDGGAPQRIGGMAKRSIFKDLNLRTGPAKGTIIGSLTGGVDYLSYWLVIPQANDASCVVWIYHFDDQSWVKENVSLGRVAFLENIAIA